MIAVNETVILAERLSSDKRVRWQARRGRDRGRLEGVGTVEPSSTPVTFRMLTEPQLLALLSDESPIIAGRWTCAQCGAVNRDASPRCTGFGCA